MKEKEFNKTNYEVKFNLLEKDAEITNDFSPRIIS